MKNIIFSATAVCLLFLMSCGKDSVKIDPVEKLGLQKIGEQIQGETRVIVWGDQTIETGYEKLFLQIIDKSNSTVSGGQVALVPMMEMNLNGETMSHSAPTDPINLGSDELFEGGVVFTMPSDGEHGKWILSIKYTSVNKQVLNFDIPVQVKANTEIKVKTLTLGNGERYVLSFHLSEKPKIGVNEANFTLHKRVSMMNFFAVSNASIKVDPRMPDMDNHGSPNNVNPSYTKNGHYAGKLNFTMSGFWTVNLELVIGEEEIVTSFDQTF